MKPPRILIVEDELIVARDISQQLVELGYEPVGICSRGEEAVALATDLKPDLVLMDIKLSGEMDGIEAARQIRSRLNRPVVFLSAFAESETLNRAKLAEPFGYIIKPFSERELRTVVEIALFKHHSETEQRQNQNLLEAILRTARDGYALADRSGRLLEVNAAAESITGYSRAELLALNLADFDARRSRADFLADIERAVSGGGDVIERRLVRKGGAVIEIELSVRYLPAEGGRLVCFFRDVTEERARERDLELKGAALGAAANAIVITDAVGVILWVNAAFSRLTGYSLAEAAGRKPGELLKSGRHDAAFYARMWAEILAGRVWSEEVINRRKDGSLYTEEMTITPVRDAEGAITHFIAIKLDISERKRAEVALSLSEERYRLLFDHNPLPMWLYDVETLQFLAVNEAAVAGYGFTREEFTNLTVESIRPAEDRASFLAQLAQINALPRDARESRHLRKNGAIFPVAIVSRPMEFHGRPARLVVAEDLTEKKALEEQFLRAQRLESLGMLASGIAHDLNNMLAPVLFAAPLLRGSVTTERDLKILDAVERSAERGSNLVRQILSFAHGTSIVARLTQLKHIVRDVVSVLEVTLPKNIVIESHIPSDVWPVVANPTQIHQLVLNLAINARDALPAGGRLRIAMANRPLDLPAANAIPGARAGDWLVIEVSDTGTGIPPNVLPHIWDAFFTTKSENKGTGLGLATVRGIVNAHQGLIQVETAVDQGTTFRVYLPAVREGEQQVDLKPPIPETAAHAELILVVDDDYSVRAIIQTILAQMGYRVLDAGDGVEAIVKFNAHMAEIDLVITDVDMPNLDGVLLARTLHMLNPRLPIIAMSGLSSINETKGQEAELKRHTEAFLTKPFSASQLQAAIHAVFAAKA
ncbi:MAG: PAS domain S-box protein [Opitutales bacterium]